MAQNAALRSTSDAILDTIIRNMMSKNLYILLFKVADTLPKKLSSLHDLV